MRPLTHFIKNPKDILIGFMRRTAACWPDTTYLRIVYYLFMGKRLHLNNPITFTEKLNWLKINDIHPEYSKLVDKYEVKKYVKEILGSEDNIIKTLGLWDSFDDIDILSLPDKFVLKTTNGGGNTSVLICKNKYSFNLDEAKLKLYLKDGKSLYTWTREYPYYNVKPRIIAEEYIEAPDNELADYKFFCFDGVPKFLFVGTERQKKGEEVKFDFYDMDFNHLNLKNGHENAKIAPQKPENFDEMVRIASALSKDMIHVRIDLYNVDGKIFFGEMTFFHFGGLVPFNPEEWDYTFGNWINLPSKN